MKRKLLSIVLAMAVMLCFIPSFAFATEDFAGTSSSVATQTFVDMPQNWSTEALEAAVSNGLINGYDNADGTKSIRPNGTLTRAEMATIVNRAFGSNEKADLTGVQDVPSGKWYTDEMAKAVQMGAMSKAQYMRPNDKITRQEVFTILARVFMLEGSGKADALASFTDADKIAKWAKDGVVALISEGYVSGSNGKLNPTNNITRAEFAKIMDNMVKYYVTDANQVSGEIYGNIMINVPSAKINNALIYGSLIIGDGVGNGSASIHNADIRGNIILRGGGTRSISLSGDTWYGRIVAEKADYEKVKDYDTSELPKVKGVSISTAKEDSSINYGEILINGLEAIDSPVEVAVISNGEEIYFEYWGIEDDFSTYVLYEDLLCYNTYAVDKFVIRQLGKNVTEEDFYNNYDYKKMVVAESAFEIDYKAEYVKDDSIQLDRVEKIRDAFGEERYAVYLKDGDILPAGSYYAIYFGHEGSAMYNQYWSREVVEDMTVFYEYSQWIDEGIVNYEIEKPINVWIEYPVEVGKDYVKFSRTNMVKYFE